MPLFVLARGASQALQEAQPRCPRRLWQWQRATADHLGHQVVRSTPVIRPLCSELWSRSAVIFPYGCLVSLWLFEMCMDRRYGTAKLFAISAKRAFMEVETAHLFFLTGDRVSYQ